VCVYGAGGAVTPSSSAGAVDDGVREVGEALLVAAGVFTQQRERLVGVDGAAFGEHALGLLDEHPGVQGGL
jgi:hypothetical protein